MAHPHPDGPSVLVVGPIGVARRRNSVGRPFAFAAVLVLALAGQAAFAGATETSSDQAAAGKSAKPLIAKPHDPTPEETAYKAKADAAIAGTLAFRLTPDDEKNLKDAATLFAAQKRDAGIAAISALRDPIAVKLATWLKLRAGYGLASEYRAFLDAEPNWPERPLLVRRLEEALFTQGGSSTEIRNHFKSGGPDNGVGFAALASSYLAEGKNDEARKYAVDAWTKMSIPSTLETGFLERFGDLLTPTDHKRRLDHLIIDEIRWNGERNARAAVARRVIALLPDAEKAAANARLAVFLQQKGAKGQIDAIPVPEAKDWGLAFHRIQATRRAGDVEGAARAMLDIPLDSGDLPNPDEWWAERRTLAYAALRVGKPKLAYELARQSTGLSVNPVKEQSFMAGWIAMRKLRDLDAAEPHFREFAKAADGPLSRAKANYWLGRLAEARQSADSARTFYEAAAKEPDTFHGQLAMEKLPGRAAISVPLPQTPSSEEQARIDGLDTLKAAVAADRAGLKREIARSLLTQARMTLKTEAERAVIAHLAEALGDTQLAVRIGKSAVGDRQALFHYAYPVHPFPSYTALRNPPETAFLLAIARQETEFNTEIVSGAGAKGLLQVMTITAKHVCRDYKIKCEIGRLLSDPSYNAMMASAYIADRMEEFRGSYVLTLAGYNAGPGRARQWIREFGDPREPGVDVIDWIERIPFQETREYVAKVLSNIQVYRARIAGNRADLALAEDLERARNTRAGATDADRASDRADASGN
ncbi:MAG: lytic transglycosylase domain-containing protein [Hyphomicrobium sp.]|nr:lytic transglycosylase domain-containing protein [Hyphomicrobium sp.]